MAIRHCQCGCGKTFDITTATKTRRFFSPEHSSEYHNQKKRESRAREGLDRICLGCNELIVRDENQKNLKYHNLSCKNRHYREQNKSLGGTGIKQSRSIRVDKDLFKRRREELDLAGEGKSVYAMNNVIEDQINRLRAQMMELRDLIDISIFIDRIMILEKALRRIE
jgi:hypothetical protein